MYLESTGMVLPSASPSEIKSQPLSFLHDFDDVTCIHVLILQSPGNLQDELYFFCRDCDRPGYQPFLLSNTSGLEFYIKQISDNASGNIFFTCLCQSTS